MPLQNFIKDLIGIGEADALEIPPAEYALGKQNTANRLKRIFLLFTSLSWYSER